MDCTNCGLPLTLEERVISMRPPLCSWCSDQACSFCGHFVAPRDQSQSDRSPIHTTCVREQESLHEPASLGGL